MDGRTTITSKTTIMIAEVAAIVDTHDRMMARTMEVNEERSVTHN